MAAPKLIGVFDTETTGVDVYHDRIVTAFIGLMNDRGEMTERWSWLLDPEVEIPEGASAVNGITTERARAEGTDWKQGIFEIIQRLDIIDKRGIPVVIYNAPFDLTILRENAAMAWPGMRPMVPHFVLDPFVIDKKLDPYRKGSRKLIHAAPVYGVEARADAHDAEADCIMAGQIALAMLRHKWLYQLDLETIHRRSIKHKADQSASFKAYKIKKAMQITGNAEREAALAEAETINGEWPIQRNAR